MTVLDFLKAAAFWVAVFSVVIALFGALLPVPRSRAGDERTRRILMTITICIVAEGALFVAAVIDDLIIQPVHECHAKGGYVSLVANKGMPGCSR